MGVDLGLRQPDQTTVVRWAWAALIANCVIVLTGGLVRLTASGLGCPTWPRCTDDSFVPHGELGLHGAIEFGNRMLTYVLVAVAIGVALAVWRWVDATPMMRRLVIIMGLGIPFQAVIGGITVLTDLNPWIVSLHLILSMGLIAASTVLLVHVVGSRPLDLPTVTHRIVIATYGVLWLTIYLGTVVTGSGPHAGDVDAPRNGLDPHVWSHVHAASVYVLVGLTVVAAIRLRASTALPAALLLLAVELAQGVIGFVQYFSDLPVALVAAHLVGATVLMAAGTRLLLSVRSSVSAPTESSPAAPQR